MSGLVELGVIVARSASLRIGVIGLALAAHLRAEIGDDRRIGDELLGVGRCLRRVILAGGCRRAVEDHRVDLVARDPAFRIGFVDRDLEAVLDLRSVIGVSAREGERDPELDGLLLRVQAGNARYARQGRDARDRGEIEGPARMSGLFHGFLSLTANPLSTAAAIIGARVITTQSKLAIMLTGQAARSCRRMPDSRRPAVRQVQMAPPKQAFGAS